MPNLEPLKPTFKTSYFVIFALTVTVAPFALIGILWAANAVLPAVDADAFKAPLLSCWAAIASSSAIVTLLGGLIKTFFKVQSAAGSEAKTDGDQSEAS